jgi:hypothetical protein
VKLKIGGWDIRVGSSCNIDNFLNSFVYNFTILVFEDKKYAPNLGDILILVALRFEQHIIKLYIPRMEEIFIIGDKIMKVEHVGTTFRLMNWKLDVENYWVLEHMDNV